MPERIDSYIGIYFADRVETFGPDENVIVSLQQGQTAEAVGDLPGVRVLAESRNTLAAAVRPNARAALQARHAVRRIESTRRKPTISVLIQLRDPAWVNDIPGLETGSRIGNIVTARADQRAIVALASDPAVISVEASREGGIRDCVVSMPYVGATAAHQPPLSEQGSEALVAIIDSGLDVLHRAFRNAGGDTRLVAIWDQRSSSGSTPQQASAAGRTMGISYSQNFGRFHSESEINGYIAANAVPSDLGRNFRLINGQLDHGHGTHVASIAAGSPFSSATGAAFPGGVAPEARIILVIPKLTSGPGDPASVGYSSSHVEALSFIRATAEGLKLPVAVNVSLGMNAGAHDGTSLLEVGFDEFSHGGRDSGFVVVKSAGNEHSFDGHAEVQPATGQTVQIEWDTTGAFRVQDYIEFWFPSSDDLEFDLVPPAGRQIHVDRSTPNAQDNLPSTEGTYYLALVRYHHDNGDARLLMVARNNNGHYSRSGHWTLKITGRAVVSRQPVHAWVERDEARALNFSNTGPLGRTLSIPGTARTVVCVGACASKDPIQVANFSSQGPSRDERHKPELVAPGIDIVAAASGTNDGTVGMAGTSMAAPHVTGAIALLLSNRKRRGLPQLNAAQIRAALSQRLGGYNGTWQADQGYGRLDIPGLFNAFDP